MKWIKNDNKIYFPRDTFTIVEWKHPRSYNHTTPSPPPQQFTPPSPPLPTSPLLSDHTTTVHLFVPSTATNNKQQSCLSMPRPIYLLSPSYAFFSLSPYSENSLFFPCCLFTPLSLTLLVWNTSSFFPFSLFTPFSPFFHPLCLNPPLIPCLLSPSFSLFMLFLILSQT